MEWERILNDLFEVSSYQFAFSREKLGFHIIRNVFFFP